MKKETCRSPASLGRVGDPRRAGDELELATSMKENIKPFLIIFLFLSLMLGCSSPSNSVSNNMESQFLTAVPVINMNKDLELSVHGDEKKFRLGSKIQLRIQNQSPNSILLEGDSHIKLFSIKDAKWIEVKNQITYSGSILLSPQGTPLLDVHFTLVKPTLDKNMMNTDEEHIPLRIVTIGEIMNNDTRTGKFVGAYIDVYITP